jgi:hypothetical protein
MSKVIEIPQGKRSFRYRFFEILPFVLSVLMVALLPILSWISPILGSIYLLLIVIMNLVKAVGIAYRMIQGQGVVKASAKVDWQQRMRELDNAKESLKALGNKPRKQYAYTEHIENLQRIAMDQSKYPKSDEIWQAVIVTMYNESIDVLTPTLECVANVNFNKQRMIVILAYEERGGEEAEKTAFEVERQFKNRFAYFELAKHPKDIPGEVIGKGANITNAGRALQKLVEREHIPAENVIVTTLDSDNKPHACYFDQVAYEFIAHEDRQNLAYQPVSLFTNNIWDAPAVTRVVATTNSFWNLICTMRPHMLRNFASHSQPLQPLIGMNFWSTRTIVEDGHQYWRSLFYLDGKYEVIPIRAPIYQDAVLSDTLWKTLKAQWIQLRRWDYGASDTAYVADYLFSKKRKISFISLFPKFFRRLDGDVTLAAVAPIIMFGGWVPLIFNFESRDLLSRNLPIVVSYIQTVAAIGILISIVLSLKMLPPKPKNVKGRPKIVMVLQWIISPIISVVYSSFCAFYSQARLAFGLYMEKFDVTHKTVKKHEE